MWSAIQWLVVRVAAIRWFFKLGWLGLLVPIVLLLKTIGMPILAVLSIVALPILFLLLLFGLPIFLVFVFGSLFMGFLGFVLTAGLAAIKIGLFVVLPVWLMWKLGSAIFRRGRGNGDHGDSTSSDVPPSDSTSGPSSDGSDGIDSA
jgi:hypothetical protein